MGARVLSAVLVAPRKIELQELPIPETGPDDGLLRVEATGVCGSDIPIYTGQMQFGRLPLVLGHEIVGRVERLGARARERWGIAPGDRIVVEEHIPCGHCELCYTGRNKFCIRRRYGALSVGEPPGLWGGYAGMLYLHPDAIVYRVSPDVPAEQVPLFIPISNGIYWVQKAGGAGIGSTVVIQGPGQHGLGCVIAARECGARHIIVVGRSIDRTRLALARELGATHTLEADSEDVVARVREISGGEMADCVVDVTPGASEPVALALDLARNGATIVVAGVKHMKPIEGFVVDKMFLKELTLKGVWGRDSRSVPAALRLIESGRYPLEKLCTHRFAVEDTARALQTAARETGDDAVHVSIIPRTS